jgi:hypothetical protein
VDSVRISLDLSGARENFEESLPLVAYDITLSEIECEVPVGTKLYLVVLGVECSTLEPPPWYGGDEEELRSIDEKITEFTNNINTIRRIRGAADAKNKDTKSQAKHALHAMAPKSHGEEEMEPKEKERRKHNINVEVGTKQSVWKTFESLPPSR